MKKTILATALTSLMAVPAMAMMLMFGLNAVMDAVYIGQIRRHLQRALEAIRMGEIHRNHDVLEQVPLLPLVRYSTHWAGNTPDAHGAGRPHRAQKRRRRPKATIRMSLSG